MFEQMIMRIERDMKIYIDHEKNQTTSSKNERGAGFKVTHLQRAFDGLLGVLVAPCAHP